MLMPMVMELAPRQIVIYEQIAEELAANGFEVEPMGRAKRGDSGGAGGNCRRATRRNC